MPPMTEPHAFDADVLVVGAGPAGLALGAALADIGLRVTLLEQQTRDALEDPAEDGREIALTHRARRVMEDLGLWSGLPASAVAPLKAAHVVDGSEQFEVGVDGDNQLRPATVVGVAPCDDLAVLKVDVTEGLRTMPLGSQADIEQGDKLLTIGYPGNGTTEDEIQVTDGVVSVVQTRADEAAIADPDFAVYPNVIQTDAAINAGNSGGPAISDEGKLIGVNTLASLQTQNQNFAIGVDRVKEVVPELAKGSSLGWAGFGFAAISEEDLAAEGLTGLGGGALVVTSVAPGTGAAREKVYVNDLVTTVNDKFVETRRQYCSAVRGVKSGDVVPIEVLDSVSNYETYYTLDVPFE